MHPDPAAHITRKVLLGDIVYLDQPGEWLWTVLGSCVLIILRAPDGSIAACHAQLPGPRYRGELCRGDCPDPCGDDPWLVDGERYTSCALRRMLDSFRRRGLSPERLSATLAGGASVLAGHDSGVGEANVAMALRILQRNRIMVQRQLTGGSKGLNAWYDSSSDRFYYRSHDVQDIRELG